MFFIFNVFLKVILDTLPISITSLLYEILSSTPINLIGDSSLLILVTKSNLRNPIKNKLFKFNYSSRNMNKSSGINNEINNKLDTSEETLNFLRSNLPYVLAVPRLRSRSMRNKIT
jgi:hypothetical protein